MRTDIRTVQELLGHSDVCTTMTLRLAQDRFTPMCSRWPQVARPVHWIFFWLGDDRYRDFFTTDRSWPLARRTLFTSNRPPALTSRTEVAIKNIVMPGLRFRLEAPAGPS